MSADVLHLSRGRAVDEAWQHYIDLVAERDERNLWRDHQHNMQIVRAWVRWRELFLGEGRRV